MDLIISFFQLGDLQELDEKRKSSRLWGPLVPWKSFIPIALANKAEYEENGPDDDDPGPYLKNSVYHTLLTTDIDSRFCPWP